MAFNATFRIFQSHKSTSVPVACQAPIIAGEVHQAAMIIQAPGHVMEKDSNLLDVIQYDWDGWDTASSIAGYRKFLISTFLKTTNYDITVSIPDAGPYPEEVAIEEFATDAGALDATVSNASTTTFSVRANHAGTGVNRVTIRADIYHRTSGGTETLINQTSFGPLTTTMAQYTNSVTLNYAWSTNERLVVKYFFSHTNVA